MAGIKINYIETLGEEKVKVPGQEGSNYYFFHGLVNWGEGPKEVVTVMMKYGPGEVLAYNQPAYIKIDDLEEFQKHWNRFVDESLARRKRS